jgi:hypothetical protein
VFILSGIRNKGTTKNGLMWHGYSSNRFADLDFISIGLGEYSEELSN